MAPENPLTIEAQAMLEIGRFFAGQPTPEEIFAFHISPELTERLYDLVDAEKAGIATDEEKRELDSIAAMEHVIISIKSEARRKMQQKAS
jgi:hypothetical protein